MNVPRAIAGAALAAAVVVLAVLALSGGSGYEIRVHLTDADGLRGGSKVVEGGVQVGTVSLKLGRGDAVIATLHIEHRYAPIGRNATAEIVSLNLLGQKSLQLHPGDRARPLPSGATLHTTVTPATDLDQVLDVLAPDTRSRLSVLIDEAGTAFTGRRQDFSRLLGELPSSLSAGAQLLGQLNAQNGTLADLVQHSDRFITHLDTQRTQLGNLVGTLGQTAATVEPRDAELQRTLRRLPGTLVTAQRFLSRLKATTVPLGPAARDLQTVAAPLDATLAQIAPFTAAARPALTQASTDAPELTALATRATPVLRAATPTLTALATTSRDLAPVSTALSYSEDNIIATAWNWSHAVELRDGLSHLFRAELTFTPATVQYLVGRLLASGSGSTTAKAGARTPARATPSHAAPSSSGSHHGQGNGTGTPAPSPAPAGTPAPPAATTTTTATTTTAPPASGPLAPVSNLLHFLTGK